MKNGGKNKSVAFIRLVSVFIYTLYIHTLYIHIYRERERERERI